MFKKLTAIAFIVTLLLAFGVTASASETYIYANVSDYLNIRSGPGTEYDLAGQAGPADSLLLLGSEGSWYLIYYWGVTGYVSGDYISFTKPVSEATRQAGAQVVEYAKNFIGVPYSYGGSTPSGFDCSGFVRYVFNGVGISLPRDSYSQMGVGTPVTRDELIPGDLVVFRSGGHVGIYTGNNQYIHSPQTGRTVSIDDMNRELYCARRIVQ